MRASRKARGRSPAMRWRETCVDGVLHVAYATAVGAETAAHRCARSLARHRTPARSARRRRMRWK
jgi:hypothetical protein